MARRHQKWASGDVFLVPLEDEGKRFAVGQVVAPEPRALNSVGIVLGRHAVSTPEEALALTLDESELILMRLTTRDSLDRRFWSIIGNKPLGFPIEIYPWHRATTFVGTKIYGSGAVSVFAKAFFGYGPWDAYLDPEYLDKMLIHPALKPTSLKYKKDFPKDNRA
jgi:hypothetical protein